MINSKPVRPLAIGPHLRNLGPLVPLFFLFLLTLWHSCTAVIPALQQSR